MHKGKSAIARRNRQHARRVRYPENWLESRDTTQPWRDFTNIKAKQFLPPTDSKFHVAALLSRLMKLSLLPKSLVAKS